jgi:hypothetical protein
LFSVIVRAPKKSQEAIAEALPELVGNVSSQWFHMLLLLMEFSLQPFSHRTSPLQGVARFDFLFARN